MQSQLSTWRWMCKASVVAVLEEEVQAGDMHQVYILITLQGHSHSRCPDEVPGSGSAAPLLGAHRCRPPEASASWRGAPSQWLLPAVILGVPTQKHTGMLPVSYNNKPDCRLSLMTVSVSNTILGAVNLASSLAVQATDYAAQLAAAFGALAQAAEQSASATLLLEVRAGPKAMLSP